MKITRRDFKRTYMMAYDIMQKITAHYTGGGSQWIKLSEAAKTEFKLWVLSILEAGVTANAKEIRDRRADQLAKAGWFYRDDVVDLPSKSCSAAGHFMDLQGWMQLTEIAVVETIVSIWLRVPGLKDPENPDEIVSRDEYVDYLMVTSHPPAVDQIPVAGADPLANPPTHVQDAGSAQAEADPRQLRFPEGETDGEVY